MKLLGSRFIACWLVVFGLCVWYSMCGLTRAEYLRSDWMTGWIDADSDCQDTRQEVLIRQSLVTPHYSDNGCRVTWGYWIDPYSGKAYTDPGALDIDHVVPLAEADRSGGEAWPVGQKQIYAQDLTTDHLFAVAKRLNRAKADRDPSRWMPPDEGAHCWYLRVWMAVKARYELGTDPEEAQAILYWWRVQRCRGGMS